jgi:zinc transport system substrate-binding protein
VRPIHSLVAAVMGELGAPGLLIDGSASGYGFKPQPDDIKKMRDADIIFFNSLDMESFIAGAIPSLRAGAVTVELAASEGVVRQELLDSDVEFQRRAVYDPHVWLSPVNAIAMVKQIAKLLAIKDPKNRGVYEVNARKYINKISKTSEKITLELSPHKNAPFIAFRNAYGYFVKNYGLNQVAAVAVNPGANLSAENIGDINSAIRRKHIECVFADQAFDVEAVKKILKNPEKVRIVTLDPFGNGIEKGEGAYLAILEGLASNMLSCFGDGKI